MMSLDEIKHRNAEQARVAASERMVPYVPFDEEEIRTYPPFPFPYIGDYRPEGWVEEGKPLFVDISGVGAEGEPAFSVRRLKEILVEEVKEGYGYALVEIGQFQGYLQRFRRVRR